MNKLALLIAVAAASAAQAQTSYTFGGAPIAVPDSPDGTCGTAAYAEIYIPDTTTIASLQVSFYIAHPFQGDLMISLRHQGTGREVLLLDRPGNPQSLIGFGMSNYGSAAAPFVMSDSANSTYDIPQIAVPGIPSVTGMWRPESPLAAFSGESAVGVWRLIARDCAGMDTGSIIGFNLMINGASLCYANCDGSQQAPVLNVGDLTCFLTKFATGCTSPSCYANCDGSVQAPFLNVADLTCFLQRYAQGCGSGGGLPGGGG